MKIETPSWSIPVFEYIVWIVYLILFESVILMAIFRNRETTDNNIKPTKEPHYEKGTIYFYDPYTNNINYSEYAITMHSGYLSSGVSCSIIRYSRKDQ